MYKVSRQDEAVLTDWYKNAKREDWWAPIGSVLPRRRGDPPSTVHRGAEELIQSALADRLGISRMHAPRLLPRALATHLPHLPACGRSPSRHLISLFAPFV
ncbi:hypothetical protein ACFV9E_41395 [Streptomyces sp. NPDC059835]|uniref:hypothetical protein n=1 Tax=Streptomyces sp. NPDC059835 TaxID=3346967 RepID=UPI0036509FFA